MAARFPLEVVVSAIDRVSAPMKRIQTRIDRFFAPVRKVAGAFHELVQTSGVAKLGGAVSDLGKGIGNVARETGALVAKVGGLAALAGGALIAIVNGYAHAGESAVTAADKVGISVEALQEFRYGAEQSNVEQEALDLGLTQLSKRLGLVAQGNKGAAVGFERLGIKVFDAAGKVRPLTQLVPEIADRLNELDDPAKRVALATQVFGKSGADLIPFLREGSRGIGAMSAQAHELGIVLGDEAARAGDAFLDSQSRLGSALAGVRNVIGSALLPVLQDLVEKVTRFVVENRPQIEAWAKAFAGELPANLAAVRDFFVDLRDKMEPLVAIGAFFVEHFGAANTVLGVLAVILGAKLVVALVTLIPTVYALGAAILTTPIGWILLGIAAVIAIGVLLVKNWDAIAGFFVGIWNWIREKVSAAWTWIMDTIGDFVPILAVIKHWDKVREFFLALWDVVKGAFARAWDWLKEWWPVFLGPVGLIIKKWGTIRDFFVGLWDHVKGTFQRVHAWIFEKIAGLLDLLPDWVKTRLGLTVQTSAPLAAPIDTSRATGGPGAGGVGAAGNATVRVQFENLPRGARVEHAAEGGTDLDLSMGYANAGT